MVKRRMIPLLMVLFLSPLWGGGSEDLLGDLTREEILSALPEWQAVTAAYEPDPEAVALLKAVSRPVEIKVYLGTWCPDSKSHVSEFFRVLDEAGNPLLNASYIGIPRDRALRAEYYRDRDIVRLPTFLVFVDGAEKGRIIEVPTVSVESDLADILQN